MVHKSISYELKGGEVKNILSLMKEETDYTYWGETINNTGYTT